MPNIVFTDTGDCVRVAFNDKDEDYGYKTINVPYNHTPLIPHDDNVYMSFFIGGNEVKIDYNDVDTPSSTSAENLRSQLESYFFDVATGGGGVSSVFGRTGAVVAASGDYDADEITETASKEFVAPADNTKLGHISVTQAVDLDTIESDTATNNAKVSFPEAPSDGQEYVRKNAAWAVASGGGGGGLSTKSGEVAAGSFSGNPKTATVTFSTAFSDANYSVAMTGQGVDKYTITAANKAAGSFDIVLNSNSAPSNPVLWTAIAHGET